MLNQNETKVNPVSFMHVTRQAYAVYGRRVNGHYEMYDAPVYRRAIFSEIVEQDGRIYHVRLNGYRPVVLRDVTEDMKAKMRP